MEEEAPTTRAGVPRVESPALVVEGCCNNENVLKQGVFTLE
jgi:hypothetical protein